MATYSTAKLQLHIWKNKFIKYSLHGSRFVKHIFLTTWWKRIWNRSYDLGEIAYFQYESRKDSLHACFLVGGGGWAVIGCLHLILHAWDQICIYTRSTESLCICYSKYTLLHFSLAVYIYIYIYIFGIQWAEYYSAGATTIWRASKSTALFKFISET